MVCGQPQASATCEQSLQGPSAPDAPLCSRHAWRAPAKLARSAWKAFAWGVTVLLVADLLIGGGASALNLVLELAAGDLVREVGDAAT